MARPSPEPLLPPGYASLGLLAARPGVQVHRARGPRGEVALRLEHGSGGRESRAELEVLSTLEHPGLARLVDHGTLPDGTRFLARAWVEGTELSALVGAREARDLGRIVARLCPALDHLHAHGFAHGDLKAANVLVGSDDRPVLTDFGLASALGRGDRDPAGGTYLFAAPELLAGGRPDERSDLFALGVLLHELLVPGRRDLQAFYGEFPRRPFLEVLGTADRLPEWSRDLVERLVARDPAQRPVSAGAVGRLLASRLGLRPQRGPLRVELRASPLIGREAWVRARLADPALRNGVRAWRVDAREDVDAVVRALVLIGSIAGEDLRRIDLDRLERATASDLDREVSRALAGTGLRLCVGGAVPSRALAALERGRRLAGEEAPGLLWIGSGPGPAGWEREDLPALEEAALHAFLRRHLEPEDDERLERLAERIHVESAGVGTIAAGLLGELPRGGLFMPGTLRPRLRPGDLPRDAGRRRASADLLGGLGPGARLLLAAVLARRSGPLLDRLERVAAALELELTPALQELVTARRVRLSTRGGERTVEALPPRPRDAGLEEAQVRRVHLAWAEVLEEDGELAAYHRWRGREDGAQAWLARVLGEVDRLHDARLPGRALDLLEDLARAAEERDEPAPPAVLAELARAEAVLGLVDAAQDRLARLEQDPAQRGAAQRVRSLIAVWGQRHAEAVEHMERAHELGAADAVDVAMARLRLAFEQGEWAEVERWYRAVEDSDAPVPVRHRVNLLGVGGMAAFYRGEVELARERLATSLEEARRDGALLHEASVHVNLGLVERRLGDLERAGAEFLAARRGYERAGFLPGIAQVQGLHAAVLRERGDLLAAEGLLEESLATCERLGDAPGALAKRGMLGLVLAERGLVHGARRALGDAACELLGAGRRLDAALLEARSIELEARCGLPLPIGSGEVAGLSGDARWRLVVDELPGDPRIGLWLARGALCAGAPNLAHELLVQGAAAAQRLGREALARELAQWLDALDGGEAPPLGEAAALLAATPCDPAALEAAAELELERGRSGLALRYLHAVAARGEGEAARRARERIEVTAEVVHAGLDAAARASHERHLLGVPDPWPEDFTGPAEGRDEELEMEVLSILEINQRLVDQEDLPTLLGAIVESALEVTGAERGFVVLEERGELVLDLAFDSRRGDIERPEVEVSRSIVRQALDREGPLRLSNASADPSLGQAPSVMALDLRSVLCQSFVVQEGVRGVIYLDDRLRASAFGERAERLLALLAGQAALAIRQVRRLDEIRALNEQLGREVTVKESEVLAARRALDEAGMARPVSGMVGDSPAMRAVHALLRKVAPSTLPVLVWGESGTGKELAARALHDLSPRREGPFVGENCAAIPASLMESELFGVVEGAFTGAERDSEGLFERAGDGTLFLDEVGELPLEMQAKLLRVLETRRVRRVGGTEEREVDFRLVVATHRDLAAEVEAGRFREDLYYRLDGVRVDLPSLAERMEDVPLLVDHFVRLQERKDGRRRRVAPAVLRALCERAWPGNVRELANEVARLCVLSAGDLEDPGLVRPARVGLREGSGPAPVRSLADLEREAILEALRRFDDDKRRAADALGISRAKLYQRLKQWRDEEEGDGA